MLVVLAWVSYSIVITLQSVSVSRLCSHRVSCMPASQEDAVPAAGTAAGMSARDAAVISGALCTGDGLHHH